MSAKFTDLIYESSKILPVQLRRAKNGRGRIGDSPARDIHALHCTYLAGTRRLTTPSIVRHKKIVDYKANPSHCTDEEWESILTSTFVDLKPVADIEIRADIQSDGTSVTLSFRKNVQGITVGA